MPAPLAPPDDRQRVGVPQHMRPHQRWCHIRDSHGCRHRQSRCREVQQGLVLADNRLNLVKEFHATAIVNTEFVRQFHGDDLALGRRIKHGRADSDTAWMTVVSGTGVVRSTGLGVAPQPEILVPYTQWGRAETATLMARTGPNADATARAIGQVSSTVDPRVPPSGVRYLESMIADSLGGRDSTRVCWRCSRV